MSTLVVVEARFVIPCGERLKESTRNLSSALPQGLIRRIGLAGSAVLAIEELIFMFGLSMDLHGRKER